MLQPYRIEHSGTHFEVSQREDNGLVSYILGAVTDRIMFTDLVKNSITEIEHYLQWEANDCRFRAEKAIRATGLFTPGKNSIYWVSPVDDGSLYMRMNCWTPVIVPDSMHLETIFDALRVIRIDPDTIWTEVARLADSRTLLGIAA